MVDIIHFPDSETKYQHGRSGYFQNHQALLVSSYDSGSLTSQMVVIVDELFLGV